MVARAGEEQQAGIEEILVITATEKKSHYDERVWTGSEILFCMHFSNKRNENLFPVLRVKFGPLSDLEAPKSISKRNDWILLLLKKGHSSWL